MALTQRQLCPMSTRAWAGVEGPRANDSPSPQDAANGEYSASVTEIAVVTIPRDHR
jgi:hypothetical protein